MRIDHNRDCPLCDGGVKCRWHSGELDDELSDPKFYDPDGGLWDPVEGNWWVYPAAVVGWMAFVFLVLYFWGAK